MHAELPIHIDAFVASAEESSFSAAARKLGLTACGMGLAMLPLPHVAPLLESGELRRVLPGWHADTGPLSIYYSSRKLVPAKTRAFVDYIVEAFRASGNAARFAGG